VVEMDDFPVPSRLSERRTLDSEVWRSIEAVLSELTLVV